MSRNKVFVNHDKYNKLADGRPGIPADGKPRMQSVSCPPFQRCSYSCSSKRPLMLHVFIAKPCKALWRFHARCSMHLMALYSEPWRSMGSTIRFGHPATWHHHSPRMFPRQHVARNGRKLFTASWGIHSGIDAGRAGTFPFAFLFFNKRCAAL